jgi:hypothetical protein
MTAFPRRNGPRLAVCGGTPPEATVEPTRPPGPAWRVASTELGEMLGSDRTLVVRRPAASSSVPAAQTAAARPPATVRRPPLAQFTTAEKRPPTLSEGDAIDPRLARIIEAWPRLSRAAQEAILAMIGSAGVRKAATVGRG